MRVCRPDASSGPISRTSTPLLLHSRVDVVLNLAADGGASSQDGMNAGWEPMLGTISSASHNVLETARREGVSRVILASSGATANGASSRPYKELVSTEDLPLPQSWEMVNEYSEPKPISLYGVTKLFGEDLGRYFAATTPMSVINLRISSCGPVDQAGPGRAQANWASYRDLQQLTIKCIEAPPTIKFDIFWATSDNRKLFRDNRRAKEIPRLCATGWCAMTSDLRRLCAIGPEAAKAPDKCRAAESERASRRDCSRSASPGPGSRAEHALMLESSAPEVRDGQARRE